MDHHGVSEKVLYRQKENIARITINRPDKLNCLDRGSWKELHTALNKADAADVRAVVLTGEGDAFCTGDDINELKAVDGINDLAEMFDDIMSVFESIEENSKPILAKVNGPAYGGGFEIVMSADFAIASTDAEFAQPETKIGAWPAYAGVRLNDFVGRKRAAEIMMTGDSISPQEAERFGLVNKVVEPANLDSAVKTLIERICQGAPLTTTLIKEYMNSRVMTPNEKREIINSFAYLFMTEDIDEGIDAFLENRKPEFQGR